ncbi:MAG: hypothetical protein JNN27_14210 [Planctomycetes bacterium]|nr:hypothetical protein [Planctomycetota bacterium]
MKKKDLGDFLEGLNKEDAQERGIEAHEGSFFATAPDDATIVTRAREFDDVPKHWVRREIWLKTVKRIQKAKGAGLRLLTLPGRHQFEVKLYKKEGLLAERKGDGGDCLEVVGFETDPTVFGLLATAEPKLLELLRGDILHAFIEPQSVNGKAIRAHAPYDVINLDLTANIATKNDGPYSPFLRGVRECFQIQGNQTGSWALMVTFRAGMSENEPAVIRELEGFFQQNLLNHLRVKEACLDRYRVETAKEFLANHPEEGLGQITGKWVIEQGHQFEWECKFYRHAAYDRHYSTDKGGQRYSLRKLVFEFSRRLTTQRQLVLTTIPAQSWHADDLARLFDRAALLSVDEVVAKMDPEYKTRIEKEIELWRDGAPE